jgi:hypothetical protein
MTRQD